MKQMDPMRVPGASPGHPQSSPVSLLSLSEATGERPSDQRYVSRRELRTLFPVSDMTIWRWMGDPAVAFPRPVKLGRNGRNFWWLPAIHEWERNRAGSAGVGKNGRAV
jgi:predicted DNA-binding transcriptional regulator AlpA